MFPHLDFNLVGDVTGLFELLLEILVFTFIISTVGHSLASDLGVGDPGVLPLRHSVVVVNEEDPAVRVNSLLPALRESPQVVLVSSVGNIALTRERRGSTVPWVDPGSFLAHVVDEENSTIGRHLHRPAGG